MKHLSKPFFLICIFSVLSIVLPAQEDDWDTLLEEELSRAMVFETAAFKSSRILNGLSIENLPGKGLDLRIAHRFAEFNTTENNFFGLDEASTYFGLYYGLTDRMNIGIARATYNQTNYGFARFAVLRQSTGEKKIPLTLALTSSINHTSKKYPDKNRDEDFISRFDYTYQLLIGRKFNDRISIQLSPTLVHRNLVETTQENNDLFALGVGGRFLITRRVAFNAEYYWVINKVARYGYNFYDPVAMGFDIQLGSHVFQLMVTNVAAMTENKFIGETTSNFFHGDIRFGFNISQVFSLGKIKD
ncbi:MAG: DUF5777 family beta-barrel protein [Bacteroidales bacterium]|jgi:hypothetical protein|nr:DUF5777 family beta-barrel protein [Bacteroidales bacterium]